MSSHAQSFAARRSWPARAQLTQHATPLKPDGFSYGPQLDAGLKLETRNKSQIENAKCLQS